MLLLCISNRRVCRDADADSIVPDALNYCGNGGPLFIEEMATEPGLLLSQWCRNTRAAIQNVDFFKFFYTSFTSVLWHLVISS